MEPGNSNNINKNDNDIIHDEDYNQEHDEFIPGNISDSEEWIPGQNVSSKSNSSNNKNLNNITSSSYISKFFIYIFTSFLNIIGIGNDLRDRLYHLYLIFYYTSNKEYSLSFYTYIKIFMIFLYIISPIDIIPDNIPFAGLLDDLFLIRCSIYWFDNEIEKFKLWNDQKLNIHRD